MFKTVYSILFFSVFIAIACVNESKKETASAVTTENSEGKAKTERSIRNASVQLLKNKIDYRGNDYVLIDVRTKEEYDDGFIPTAQWANIQDEESFVSKIDHLDRNGVYFVYCQSGVRSLRAFEKMSDMGFTEVYNVRGGYSAWSEMMSKE